MKSDGLSSSHSLAKQIIKDSAIETRYMEGFKGTVDILCEKG